MKRINLWFVNSRRGNSSPSLLIIALQSSPYWYSVAVLRSLNELYDVGNLNPGFVCPLAKVLRGDSFFLFFTACQICFNLWSSPSCLLCPLVPALLSWWGQIIAAQNQRADSCCSFMFGKNLSYIPPCPSFSFFLCLFQPFSGSVWEKNTSESQAGFCPERTSAHLTLFSRFLHGEFSVWGPKCIFLQVLPGVKEAVPCITWAQEFNFFLSNIINALNSKVALSPLT